LVTCLTRLLAAISEQPYIFRREAIVPENELC